MAQLREIEIKQTQLQIALAANMSIVAQALMAQLSELETKQKLSKLETQEELIDCDFNALMSLLDD